MTRRCGTSVAKCRQNIPGRFDNLQRFSPTVFVCYSHIDSRWLDRLQVNLKPLVRDNVIEVWSDRRTRTEQDRLQEIKAALDRARVAIMLVSADFLASVFIASEELPVLLVAARNRGLEVLPVIVGPSRFWESSLSQFQTINPPHEPLPGMKKGDAEQVLVTLSRNVEKLLG